MKTVAILSTALFAVSSEAFISQSSNTKVSSSLLRAGKSEFVLFCCMLWCVQYEDSTIRILHWNLVRPYLITVASRSTNICCNHFSFIFLNLGNFFRDWWYRCSIRKRSKRMALQSKFGVITVVLIIVMWPSIWWGYWEKVTFIYVMYGYPNEEQIILPKHIFLNEYCGLRNLTWRITTIIC